MTDRELLELAAKAAGYDTSHSWNAERMVMPNPEVGLCIPDVSTCWNPLADDGDALRLAVRLGLEEIFIVTISGVHQSAVACDASDADGAEESFKGDPYAATRLAIVRAAAEIGRNMK